MIENNEGTSSQNDNDLHSTVGNTTTGEQNGNVTIQGTTFTPEEIEQANKPQPNLILDKVNGPNTETTRDNERVNARANEASDSTDTNTGGMIAGGAKGANQS